MQLGNDFENTSSVEHASAGQSGFRTESYEVFKQQHEQG